MRIHSPATLGVFLFLLLPLNEGISAADGLPELAARIREAEAIFRDCEFTTEERLETTKDLTKRFDVSPYRERIVKHRMINQGLNYRTDMTKDGYTYDGKSHDDDRRWLFDGQTSRDSQKSALANITTGKTSGLNRHSLHRDASGLGDTFPDVPLSLIVEGLDAIRAARPEDAVHSFQLAPTVKWHLYDRGVELIDGLSMHRISIQQRYNDGAAIENCDLWFVPDRHYFVGRVAWRKETDPTLPYSQSNVTRWKQFDNEIWYPAEFLTRVLDLPRQDPPLKVEKPAAEWVEADLMKRVTLTMEVQSLSPNYPLEFFQTLDLKDGAVVYEVADGKIVNSYKHSAPPTARFGGWWLPGFIVAFLLTAAVMLYRRWSRQRAEAQS